MTLCKKKNGRDKPATNQPHLATTYKAIWKAYGIHRTIVKAQWNKAEGEPPQKWSTIQNESKQLLRRLTKNSEGHLKNCRFTAALSRSVFMTQPQEKTGAKMPSMTEF